ncbi:MAG: hypothetical protein MZW92_48615 [Comamonadaceae bacterium]|nr:hypothetical protein [Comamonadaceae bacterium]
MRSNAWSSELRDAGADGDRRALRRVARRRRGSAWRTVAYGRLRRRATCCSTTPAWRQPAATCGRTASADWRWALGVNLMGVAHGIRHFVPRMIAAGLDADSGHMVNTASIAGWLCAPLHGRVQRQQGTPWSPLTETLHHDLRLAGSQHRRDAAVPGLRADRRSAPRSATGRRNWRAPTRRPPRSGWRTRPSRRRWPAAG